MKMLDHPSSGSIALLGSVIPAQAGIQVGAGKNRPWIPASAGMTTWDSILLLSRWKVGFSSAVLYPLVHELLCENSLGALRDAASGLTAPQGERRL